MRRRYGASHVASDTPFAQVKRARRCCSGARCSHSNSSMPTRMTTKNRSAAAPVRPRAASSGPARAFPPPPGSPAAPPPWLSVRRYGIQATARQRRSAGVPPCATPARRGRLWPAWAYARGFRLRARLLPGKRRPARAWPAIRAPVTPPFPSPRQPVRTCGPNAER